MSTIKWLRADSRLPAIKAFVFVGPWPIAAGSYLVRLLVWLRLDCRKIGGTTTGANTASVLTGSISSEMEEDCVLVKEADWSAMRSRVAFERARAFVRSDDFSALIRAVSLDLAALTAYLSCSKCPGSRCRMDPIAGIEGCVLVWLLQWVVEVPIGVSSLGRKRT